MNQIKNRQTILIGGGQVWKNETVPIDEYIVKLAKEDTQSPQLLLIPTSSNDREDYIQAVKKIYESLGCEVNVLRFLHNKYTKENVRAEIQNSSIIYLGSGDPAILENVLSGMDLKETFLECLNKYSKILVGSSAGAALLSENYIDVLSDDLKLQKGWGIIPQITVVPHYSDKLNMGDEGFLLLRDLEIAHFDLDKLCRKIQF